VPQEAIEDVWAVSRGANRGLLTVNGAGIAEERTSYLASPTFCDQLNYLFEWRTPEVSGQSFDA
jgi:hypothetical protein